MPGRSGSGGEDGELTGITCLAEGADTIFADVVLTLAGRLVVLVPALAYRDFLPPGHRPVFDRICSAAHEVRRLPHPEPDLAALMDASRQLVDASDELIAVWDGQPARGYGAPPTS